MLSQSITVMVTIIQVQYKASLSWARPREPQLSAGKDGTTDPEKTCHYCKDTGHDLDKLLVSPMQERLPSSQTVRGRVKLKAPTSGGHRGGAKVDPTVPSSPNTQFDDMFCTLVSNAVSLETKQRVMQRAVSNCPNGYSRHPR